MIAFTEVIHPECWRVISYFRIRPTDKRETRQRQYRLRYGIPFRGVLPRDSSAIACSAVLFLPEPQRPFKVYPQISSNILKYPQPRDEALAAWSRCQYEKVTKGLSHARFELATFRV